MEYMTPEKLQAGLDSGEIKLVHLYDSKNVLMPRGSMQKESIGVYLLEHLKSSYESWTDPEYGDNPTEPELNTILYKNLMGEAQKAWEDFAKWRESKEKGS